ncbi:DEAD/DEAH box helicase [Bacteroides sp. 51]|uniref:DEAD/DEAH box helicase n=1 Tax=Bacteroides sp. 51 TaxID=2302938 RepID=UPI0013D70EDF|nr:AAA domain-containing protein [Bacteroides sp. 51]NDV81270.1 DNA helicase [Bacteroides sp. 51]
MEFEISDCFEILLSACKAENITLKTRYKQIRDLLERICREQMQSESLQMTDLSARINYVAVKVGLNHVEQNRLHTFRITSNKILNRQEEAGQENLLRDIKTLAFFIRKVYQTDIPKELYRLLPKTDATYIVKAPGKQVAKRMRVCFQYMDELYLYVIPTDAITDEPLRVRYNLPEINDEFAETCELLWQHAQLNLLDVSEDEDGILTPRFIVLEPDYLLDISSLAECYKDYGHHPFNYQLTKLQPVQNARPILLGNIVNLFLDEWIYAKYEPDYMECMKKAFRTYPIELAACKDLQDPKEEAAFFADCRMHFEHIRQAVQEIFKQSGYQLDKTDAVLEPSYICEALGLQGRLDYMQRDMRAFIEMKSGKADEYSIRNTVTPKENNKVQMLLYQAVLEYSMEMDHKNVTPYLLYTRYPLLYPARSSWAMVRRVINLRNRIVADEYSIQLRNSIHYTADKIGSITADLLNERKIKGRFWEQYLRPGIDRTVQAISKLSETERAYFYSLYNFITKEQYTAKSGDVDYEGRTGAAALWLSTLEEKREAGEILYDLQIVDNHAADEHKAYVILKGEPDAVSPEEIETLPNFREGDAIVLYQRNATSDNVTNKMVFKGNIEAIGEDTIKIRLRATQHNPSVLPMDSLYAVEHDSMDTAFRSMYLGLSSFLFANQERRDLLLGKRLPEFDVSLEEDINSAEDDFTRIALKAKAARDYFLLIGPPGTGKTSCALRRMVETFCEEPGAQILLLAYTNKAVDEICKALRNITPKVDFIRLGSELSCEPQYREYLIENVLSSCNRRSAVNDRISRCRIFVGTVATLSGKQEIFRLKRFDVAIVDEATQILEPQILGLLCHRNEDGRNTIGKFILIGDHKQLPAVVLQSSVHTEIHEESLRSIGLTNLKDSLFERLYRQQDAAPRFPCGIATPLLPEEGCPKGGVVGAFGKGRSCDNFLDILCKQGRMHPEVAHFSNTHFYAGKLESVGLPHQLEEQVPYQRIAFFPSEAESPASSAKVNHSEASIVTQLAVGVYERTGSAFDPTRTLGIITPYRSQIALIKKEIARLGIDALNHILIDTVERFQGSERDIIIYSFCVNKSYQLRLLSNVIEEDGNIIDRKLNVALTRARKQMLITGVPHLLNLNPVYSNLLKLMITD